MWRFEQEWDNVWKLSPKLQPHGVLLQSQCSSDQFQNIARFLAAEFGPLALFYILVVVFKISATSLKLSSFVILSQWMAEPLSVRVVLRGVQEYPKINVLSQLLESAYGIIMEPGFISYPL